MHSDVTSGHEPDCYYILLYIFMLGYTQACLISRIESANVRKSERIISLNIVVNPSLASLITVGTRFKILLLTSY